MAFSGIVKTLQRVIGIQYPSVTADGIYGTITARNYSRLPEQLKEAHDVVAASLGYIPPQVLSLDGVSTMAENVAKGYRVPVSYLLKTIFLENKVVLRDDTIFVEYEGKYKGLGQFDEETWTSVMGTDFSDVKSSEQSLIAIAKLYVANKQSFMIQHGKKPFTDSIAYLYHNQGAGSASRFLRGQSLVYPKQSSRALAVFDTARKDYGSSKHVKSGFIT